MNGGIDTSHDIPILAFPGCRRYNANGHQAALPAIGRIRLLTGFIHHVPTWTRTGSTEHKLISGSAFSISWQHSCFLGTRPLRRAS